MARNAVGRDLIVGDVHGCFTKLRAALDAVGFDPAADRLFSVGDLVDRGGESAEALEWLGQPWFFAVCGNHESMAVEFSAGRIDAGIYAANGGAWLIGMTPAERQPFVDAFAALPLALELETADGLVGIVHADCPTDDWVMLVYGLCDAGEEVREMVESAVLWNRGRVEAEISVPVRNIRAVVVGHTPVRAAPRVLGNVHFIDSGAWLPSLGADFVLLDAATLLPALSREAS